MPGNITWKTINIGVLPNETFTTERKNDIIGNIKKGDVAMFDERFNKSEDPIMNLGEKEEELMDSYNESEDEANEEYEEFVEADVEDEKIARAKKMINIFFTVIIIIIVAISIDIIAVSRFNKGPFFALPLHNYNDGGSKAYYGIGYKVIKYHQLQGRRDKEIGLWSLKYNTEPITMKDVDLAIEFTGHEVESFEKYYKKFVRIISTLHKVDEKNHKIIMGYQDEDNKYSLDVVCQIVKDQENIASFEEEKPITIIGTVSDFEWGTGEGNNQLIITNCFAEQ